jgi:ATP-dependent Lon protease
MAHHDSISSSASGTQEVPVLPLRDVVVYPHMVIPLFVGRDKSIRALDAAMATDKQILLIAQKSADVDDPGVKDLHEIGTLANILQLLKLPDGTVKVLVEGNQRARIDRFLTTESSFSANIESLEETLDVDEREQEVLMRSAVTLFDQYVKLNKKVPPEVLTSLSSIDEAGRLADTMAAHMALKLDEKQRVLEMIDIQARLEHLMGLMESENDILQMEKRIRGRVKRQMEKNQREYYLNEQMKAIQKELGELEDAPNEIEDLAKRIEAAGMPREAKNKAQGELNKLKLMSPMSAEATVVRNYIDTLVAVPWKKRTRIRNDIKVAEAVLDKDHYGLERVKERILEYLAVQQRVRKLKGPILCLVGPPGVGKTSLGQSIARATNRQVRAHVARRRARRGRDPRPSSDLYRRAARQDHPESVQGRLAQRLLPARRDRQDGDGLPGRSGLGAARGPGPGAEPHLQRPLPGGRFRPVRGDVRRHRQHPEHPPGAPRPHGGDPALGLYRGREGRDRRALSGPQADEEQRSQGRRAVDSRERAARHHPSLHARGGRAQSRARDLQDLSQGREGGSAQEARHATTVSAKNLEKYLGVQRFRYGRADEHDQVGQVTGLAWTEVGGELLRIESALVPGKGKFTYTGQLGDVMQESIQAAMTVVRSRADALGVPPDFHSTLDVHIHVPEGATPKDGPSAGVAMCTAWCPP